MVFIFLATNSTNQHNSCRFSHYKSFKRWSSPFYWCHVCVVLDYWIPPVSLHLNLFKHIITRIMFLPWNFHHLIRQFKTLIGSLLPRGPNTNSSHTTLASLNQVTISQQLFFLSFFWSLFSDLLCFEHPSSPNPDAHVTFTYHPLVAPFLPGTVPVLWEAIFQRKPPEPWYLLL